MPREVQACISPISPCAVPPPMPSPFPVTGCVSQPLISAPSDATPSARTATPQPPTPSCKAQLNGPLVQSWCPRSEALWLQRLAFVHKHGRMVVEGRAMLVSSADGSLWKIIRQGRIISTCSVSQGSECLLHAYYCTYPASLKVPYSAHFAKVFQQ